MPCQYKYLNVVMCTLKETLEKVKSGSKLSYKQLSSSIKNELQEKNVANRHMT